MPESLDRQPSEEKVVERRPYEPPTIESETILETQLLIRCGVFPRPCQKPPPQS
jgi:hypothetical protein